MDKHTKVGRRSVIAAAIGAAAGAAIHPSGTPVLATAGTGGQDALVLGSNPGYVIGTNAANTPNVSSGTTTLQATVNFGNFVTSSARSVLQIDARPAITGNIHGIEAFGRGDGTAVFARGSEASPKSVGVEASGGGCGVSAIGGTCGVAGYAVAVGVPGSTSYGVLGVSTIQGYGGAFAGQLAPLLLAPGVGTGAPTSGTHTPGELFVDAFGELFYCRGEGTPGTWVHLSAATAAAPGPVFNTLASPERFVDTRSGLGGVTGRVPAATTNSFQMSARTGASGNAALQVPDTATTLVGNLTVLGGPNISVGSYITLWAGGTQPTVSNINVGPGGVVANSFVVATSSVGGHRSLSVFNSQDCDYILDVTAYYT